MTSAPFLFGVVVGAVGAFFLGRRSSGAGGGIGGAASRRMGRSVRYSGVGRFRG